MKRRCPPRRYKNAGLIVYYARRSAFRERARLTQRRGAAALNPMALQTVSVHFGGMVEQLVANRLAVASLAAILALMLIAWLAVRVQRARRSQALAAALRDSGRGRLAVTRGPGAAGLAAAIDPAPDPFVEFTIDYRGAPGDRLVFAGRLPARPAAELVWQEGRIPAFATARRERVTLWVPRRADVVGAEYAVRGVDTGAIEHVFVDLQARFRPFLQEVIVFAEQEPEVRVALRLAGLSLNEIPPLVASLRALGRAALRQ